MLNVGWTIFFTICFSSSLGFLVSVVLNDFDKDDEITVDK